MNAQFLAGQRLCPTSPRVRSRARIQVQVRADSALIVNTKGGT
jgi:hypothetical protein